MLGPSGSSYKYGHVSAGVTLCQGPCVCAEGTSMVVEGVFTVWDYELGEVLTAGFQQAGARRSPRA